MIKKILKNLIFVFFTIILLPLASFAFEDVYVFSDGRFSDISIEDNTVVDVFPLVTIMNEKNVLVFHPLKVGKTRVCVLKNKKDKVMFNIEISNESTKINELEGFDIYNLDVPPSELFDLDLPPMLGKEGA